MSCPRCGEDNFPLGQFHLDTEVDLYGGEPPEDYCEKCGWKFGLDIEHDQEDDCVRCCDLR